MAVIEHEIKVDADVDDVFAALSTADGLAGWYATGVSGSGEPGSSWTVDVDGQPRFVWRVDSSEPPRRVRWTCEEGPGDSVGTTVEYRVVALDDGRCLVEQVHDGWPHTDGNYRKCNTLWGGLLHHLTRYAETGGSDPLFG